MKNLLIVCGLAIFGALGFAAFTGGPDEVEPQAALLDEADAALNQLSEELADISSQMDNVQTKFQDAMTGFTDMAQDQGEQAGSQLNDMISGLLGNQ